MTRPVLLRDARVAGRIVDLRMDDGVISALAARLDALGGEVVDIAGRSVIPGLHDHHVHLMAAAAAASSTDCGPPAVRTMQSLGDALGSASVRHGWVRGVNYHESVAGHLDRTALDRLRPDVPVRVQHRSGALWIVNTAGLRALTPDDAWPAGVECDAAGRPTGRLWRLDTWLRERSGAEPVPDLEALSGQLASYGITGVTDATPDLDATAVRALRSAPVRQRLTLLGDPSADSPRKIVVPDHDLPPFEDLVAAVRRSRPRPVAVHCVTRVALVLTLAVLHEVGAVAGDRIEHGAVVPPDAIAQMQRLGVRVVTQPSLPALRGEQYLADVEPEDREHLWPFASLLAGGVPVACSSDAPYGSPDPWFSMRAAAERCTAQGRPIAAHERVTAAAALRGYLGDPRDPGGAPRSVRQGAPADLVVLDAPLEAVLAEPAATHVAMTFIDGREVFRACR